MFLCLSIVYCFWDACVSHLAEYLHHCGEIKVFLTQHPLCLAQFRLQIARRKQFFASMMQYRNGAFLDQPPAKRARTPKAAELDYL